jgi:hypothetical protein
MCDFSVYRKAHEWDMEVLEQVLSGEKLPSPPYGLGVYQHKAEDFTRDTNRPAEEYHRLKVHGFYNFLLGPYVVLGNTTLSTVATFSMPISKQNYLSV